MVLGCMLTNADAARVAVKALEESHFCFVQHRTIFRLLQSSYRNEKSTDVHLVSEELKDQQKLEESFSSLSYTQINSKVGVRRVQSAAFERSQVALFC